MALLAFLVIEICFGFSVLKLDQCSECSKLIRKQDCEYGNCILSMNNESTEGICIDNGSNVDQGNLTQNCSKVKGCAYFNSSCKFFTGCSAYFFHTTFDCQQISLYCISEGDGCIDAKKCEEYLTQDICENSGSSSWSDHCKWDSGNQKCRDELCSEAGIGLTTDQECSKFRFGCIKKGQGCTESPLKECKTYESSGQDCSKLIGLDGPCELLQGSQFCQQKKWETAPITYTKDKQCDQYLKGCVSKGRGCVEKLWPCNTYNKDCTSYVGLDGICEMRRRIVEVEFVKKVNLIQMRTAIKIKLVVLPMQNHVQLLCKIVQVTREIKILVWDLQVQRECVKEQMIMNSHVL